MRIPGITCSLLCALLVAACDGDPIGPEDLAGHYTLVSSGEDGQQRELLRASESCDEWLVFGTLDLAEDASYSLVLELENDCTRGGGGVTEEERTSAGTFHVSGLTLTLAAESGTLFDEIGGFLRAGAVELIVPDLAAAGDLTLVFEQVIFIAE
ncbi:MAG: hypothetical protein ACREKI_01125 [Gemmatimonadota bacterium]